VLEIHTTGAWAVEFDEVKKAATRVKDAATGTGDDVIELVKGGDFVVAAETEIDVLTVDGALLATIPAGVATPVDLPGHAPLQIRTSGAWSLTSAKHG
jgi:hypothetical protein